MHIHTYFSTVFFYILCIFVLLSDQSYEATLNSSALCSIPLECLTSSHSRCFVPACVLSNQGGFPGQFLSFSHHNHVSLPDSAQFEPETYEFLSVSFRIYFYLQKLSLHCDVCYNLHFMRWDWSITLTQLDINYQKRASHVINMKTCSIFCLKDLQLMLINC